MSLLNSITDHVIETSEQMIKVVEQANSIMFGQDMAENLNSGSGTFERSAGIETDVMDELGDSVNAESPLLGIADGVMGDIFKDQIGPQTAWENVDAFRSAIAWKEPFIVALIVFQVLLLIITIAVVKYDGVKIRVSFLVLLAVLVKSAEMMNQYGSKHWEDFATQNYFDDGGIFMCITVSAPIVLLSFGMLLSYLREASQLLVQVKRAEIKVKYGKKKSAKSGGKTAKKDVKKEN